MAQEKSDDDVIMHPLREKGEKQLPANGILLTNPTEARFAVEELKRQGGRKRPLFHSTLCVSPQEDFFVAGPAVGAPMAVICLEKLIALGAKKVIIVSCCGCLQPDRDVGDIILPGQSVSGEGTSKYYQHENQSAPDSTIIADLEQLLTEEGFSFHRGAIWSTDAPYRERRSELEKLRKEDGVAGVDMEFSALCATANFRGISLAGIFVVSDLLLMDKWEPGFNNKKFRNQSRTLIKKLLTGHYKQF